MKPKMFLICPVRGRDLKELEPLVKKLEADYVVHFPPRDTDQVDDTGYRICVDNLKAIENADVVGIVWDGKSQGCLFDAGMAFALHKKVIAISLPELLGAKSFQDMFSKWARGDQ